MSEHTKEPWRVMWPCAQWETARLFSGARYIGSIGNSDEAELETRANADRIVSCVNACAGMDDPATDIAALKAQRDELLAALQMALADHMTEPYLHPLRDGTIEAIKCAIASAEAAP